MTFRLVPGPPNQDGIPTINSKRAGCIDCGKPLRRDAQTEFCAVHFRARNRPSERHCASCGGLVSDNSRTGKCWECFHSGGGFERLDAERGSKKLRAAVLALHAKQVGL